MLKFRNIVPINPSDLPDMELALSSKSLDARTNLRNELARKHGFSSYRQMKDLGFGCQVLGAGKSILIQKK